MQATDIGDDYKDLGMGFIETYSGLRFSLAKPKFRLIDIAHALSNTCRYGGHSSSFYSVAEHSVMVSNLMRMNGGDPREGLMHDATEAYLSDVPAPFKQFLPDWKNIDAQLDHQMREHYGIGEKTKECKEADYIALFIEAYYLIADQGECFADPWNLKQKAREYRTNLFIPAFLPPNKAKQLFLQYADRLDVKDISE